MNLIALIAAVAALLPNASTPGAVNPAVTQANIQSTICTSGYTATIRPVSSYTDKLKKQQLAGAYSGFAKLFGVAGSGYEEDHLISLELGGNPTDPKNLWPEPYNSPSGARIKDQVEDALHRAVCANKVPLVATQKAIAANWSTALAVLHLK